LYTDQLRFLRFKWSRYCQRNKVDDDDDGDCFLEF